MKKDKFIVLVGSMRFWDKIQEMYETLELQGYAVIGITPHIMNREHTKEELELLGELHLSKIDKADAIFVVNVNGYIGSTTNKEIEFAKLKNKEIIYLEDIK
jgi:hypothetical protein